VRAEWRSAQKGGSAGGPLKHRLIKKVKQAKEDLARLEQDLKMLERKGKIADGEASRRRDMLSDLSSLHEDITDLLSGEREQRDIYERGANQEEAEETRELDNAQILQTQQKRMRRQDEQLDGILDGVEQLSRMGVDINNELKVHDMLLTDLDDAVDRTSGKIKANTERIDHIQETSGGWWPIVIMVILMVLIVLLLGTNWFCYIFNTDKC